MAIVRKSASEAAETARVDLEHLKTISQVEIEEQMKKDGEDPAQPFKGLRITTKKPAMKTTSTPPVSPGKIVAGRVSIDAKKRA